MLLQREARMRHHCPMRRDVMYQLAYWKRKPTSIFQVTSTIRAQVRLCPGGAATQMWWDPEACWIQIKLPSPTLKPILSLLALVAPCAYMGTPAIRWSDPITYSRKRRSASMFDPAARSSMNTRARSSAQFLWQGYKAIYRGPITPFTSVFWTHLVLGGSSQLVST